MTDILSSIQSLTQKKPLTGDKSSILAKLQQVYDDSMKRLKQKGMEKGVINELQNFYKQTQKILTLQSLRAELQSSSVENSQTKSSTEQHLSNQQIDSAIKQSSSQYMFLRNAWQSRYQPKQNYDVQDHIDRINKVVAMVRMRTNYMTKKEIYLYEKEEFNGLHIYQNPAFIKVKEELEKMTMMNQELMQKCLSQKEHILRLESEKSALLENLTGLKKKYQQTEKTLISVSKKNICLEQDSLALKTHNSKSKLKSLRQSTDLTELQSMTLKRSTSFCKYVQELQPAQKLTEPPQSNGTNQSELPLQKVFIDISLNLSSKRQTKQQKSFNRQMTSDTQNQKNSIQNHRTLNFNIENRNNSQKLALCRSERLIIDDSPIKLRYIRNNEGSKARKTLLSAARSVDLMENTSLNKPKFQRTKSNYQNLLKPANNDGSVLTESNHQKSILVKKNYTGNDGPSITKNFKSSGRGFLSKRQEVKWASPTNLTSATSITDQN